MVESDEVLMRQFQGGDEQAFVTLVNRYKDPVFNFFLRQCHDYALAEDLAQDTFMRLFRYGRSYDCEQKFKPWFYKIALNMIRRELSTRPTRASLQDDIVCENQFFNRDYELIGAVKKAIATLPQAQREVIILKTYQGLTFGEIAQAIGCPEGTVKSRLYQAYTRLRRKLQGYRRSV